MGVKLDAFAVRALAVIDLSIAQGLVLRAGVGAGIDAVHFAPLPQDPGASLASAQDFAVVVGRSSVGLAYSLSRSVAISFVMSCDLDLSGARYVSIVDGTAAPALSPWTFRPALSVGVELQ
jgi:hypothetical protein